MIKLLKRLFKANYSVCTECGVHFEPISDYDAQVGILCQTHRKPAFALLSRKEFVQRWAALNWEKLEAQAIKDGLGNHGSLASLAGNGRTDQCENPWDMSYANWQSTPGHNQGFDPFGWPL